MNDVLHIAKCESHAEPHRSKGSIRSTRVKLADGTLGIQSSLDFRYLICSMNNMSGEKERVKVESCSTTIRSS
jgi:hypothetical protein